MKIALLFLCVAAATASPGGTNGANGVNGNGKKASFYDKSQSTKSARSFDYPYSDKASFDYGDSGSKAKSYYRHPFFSNAFNYKKQDQPSSFPFVFQSTGLVPSKLSRDELYTTASYLKEKLDRTLQNQDIKDFFRMQAINECAQELNEAYARFYFNQRKNQEETMKEELKHVMTTDLIKQIISTAQQSDPVQMFSSSKNKDKEEEEEEEEEKKNLIIDQANRLYYPERKDYVKSESVAPKPYFPSYSGKSFYAPPYYNFYNSGKSPYYNYYRSENSPYYVSPYSGKSPYYNYYRSENSPYYVAPYLGNDYFYNYERKNQEETVKDSYKKY
ncbi:unnamed protein product [Cyprideis torosa]|uniref:Uncharacterized protein n=1 Tax=Cyprideis torosa TaxID=163714 RepID=A0A7R8WDT0_9CRUS|nr:unnamed protein product [Cyprideis torosa]CAG0893553.1 unnamed protein product [Cyprideis torosa]